MKTALKVLICIGLLTSSSGCYTTTLRSGLPASPATVDFDRKWHHGLFWGIAELSGPYNLSEICPQGWAEVETETSFLNGLLYSLSSGVYTSQTVTVRCAQGSGEDMTAGAEAGDAPSPEE